MALQTSRIKRISNIAGDSTEQSKTHDFEINRLINFIPNVYGVDPI